MLVVTRKKNQVIVIGDNIVIKVIDIIDGEYVKIGVEAPKSVSIHRLEVFDTIVKENKAGQHDPITLNKTVLNELGKLFKNRAGAENKKDEETMQNKIEK
ncbi:carbon storage regulator [Candidatus Formimonas warabiya]|uniref:Translational regulator CsrA n=1 Tax=Formimonas warabiya TaxID=1761012 RepID=A0A3G1KTA1_FORW1|nr:hypothetical protein DCMF_13785 [Candidatus Formimonas warabiya]